MLRRSLDDAGFVLPLALVGAMVLLLSSLSLQAAVFQSRRLQDLEHQRLTQRDQLASAAQLWADWLSGPGRCLRSIPSPQWSLSLPPDCPAELQGMDLQQFQLGPQTVQLGSWNPEQGTGILILQLVSSGWEERFVLGSFGIRELG